MTLDLEQLEQRASEAEEVGRDSGRLTTHYEKCWLDHHVCALSRYATDVRALVEKVRELEAGAEAML